MPITCTCMGSQPPSVVRWLTRALGGSVLWQACSRLVLPRSSGRNDGYQSEFLPHNQGGEGNSRKERMFLEPRESHRLCPFQALVHLRAGALGSCERERSGQRGMERTKGHTEGPWPAELGRRCWSSWQPACDSLQCPETQSSETSLLARHLCFLFPPGPVLSGLCIICLVPHLDYL